MWSKALSERDLCVCILEMRTEAMHGCRSKILPRSAQILKVIGKVFTMHVNARSSNHDPNHDLDHDPKRLFWNVILAYVNTAIV